MDILGSTPSSNYTIIYPVVVLSYLYLFRRDLLATTQLPASTALLRRVLTVLVIIHTVYTLRLLLSPPINLFTLLDLPLTASVSAIRVALLERQRDAFPVGFQNKLSQDVETLLSRLSSFEARVVYVKYGPYPLSQCAPCVHVSDFAIFALAPTVLPYLRTLILTSFITSGPAQRPAWRTPSLVVFTAAFFAEVWWTVDGQVQFRDGKLDGWTHTHTYLSRTALLLLLPILLHHLPAHSALSPLPPFIEIYPHSRPAFPYQSSDFNLANLNTARQTPQRSSSASAPGILRPESTPLSSSSYPAQGPSTPGPSATNSIPNSIPNSAPNHNPNIPVSPFSTLNSTLSSLSTTLGTLRVLEWTRLAGMRHGEVREKMEEYYATADRNATYARGDATLRREAEKLGMGYREPDVFSRKGHESGLKLKRWPRFGGRDATWKGGDPRGLDGGENTIVGGGDDDDEEEEVEVDGGGQSGSPEGKSRRSEARRRRRERGERERAEEEEELANSPLRAKARKAARDISEMLSLVGMRGSAGAGSGGGA